MPKYLEDMPEKNALEDTDLVPGKDMTQGKASKITMLGIAEYIIKKITALPGAVKSHLENKNNPHGVTKAQIGLENVENKSSATIRSEITADNVKKSLGYTPLDAAKKGATNGVAELDSTGKVPSAQLPSFVDDVVEGYLSGGKFYKESAHTTQITGESGKIYVDLTTGKTYRWSGSAFVEISQSLALGETSTTAYRGDRGKTAYDHSLKTSGNPHGVTKSDVGLGNVPNVATNDQTPTFTTANDDTALVSGEKLSISLGKIARSILSVISLKKQVDELNSNITNLLPQYNLFSNGTSAEVQYMQIPKKKLCIVFIQVYNDVKNNAVITQLPTPTSTVIKRTVGKHVDNTMGRIRFTVSSSGQLIMGCEEFDKAVKATSISFMYEYA